MQKIASFTVDHRTLERGLYLSRQDGDVTTFDLRMRRPYADPPLSVTQAHSLEHLLATALRNGEARARVVYAGPMGCMTGFYVLYRGMDPRAAVRDIVNAFERIGGFLEMPGDSEQECGDCRTLDLTAGKSLAAEYLQTVRTKTKPDEYISYTRP